MFCKLKVFLLENSGYMNKSWLLQYSGFWKEYSEAEEQTCLAYFTTNYYQKKPELSWEILPEDGYD